MQRIAKPKGPWCYWNEQKILLHPSISATLVKVHLISHNPIHPINSRLLLGSYKKYYWKGRTSSPFHVHTALHMGSWEHLSSWAWILTASAMNEGGGSELPSHLSSLSLQPLFLQERQQHFMGDWNNCGKRPKRCLNWYLKSKSYQLQRSVDFNRLDH